MSEISVLVRYKFIFLYNRFWCWYRSKFVFVLNQWFSLLETLVFIQCPRKIIYVCLSFSLPVKLQGCLLLPQAALSLTLGILFLLRRYKHIQSKLSRYSVDQKKKIKHWNWLDKQSSKKIHIYKNMLRKPQEVASVYSSLEIIASQIFIYLILWRCVCAWKCVCEPCVLRIS